MSVPNPNRRILLVSYYFGPDGPTGGFRWTALTRLLLERGWEFDVITGIQPDPLVADEATREPWSAGNSDEQPPDPHGPPGSELQVFVVPYRSSSFLTAAEAGLGRVHRFQARGPGRAHPPEAGALRHPSAPDITAVDPKELRIWTPGQITPLHSRISREISSFREAVEWNGWARAAGRLARILIQRRRYGCLIVSSPPHETQVVGIRLARDTAIPYLADLRDPWIIGMGEVARYLPGIARHLGRRREWRMVRRADALIHNTKLHRRAVAEHMALRGLESRSRPVQWVVPNGYDETSSYGMPDVDTDAFRIAFTGWLHSFMDVRALFRAVGDLVQREGLSPARCRVELVGSGETFVGEPIRAIAAAYGLEHHLDLVPRVPRRRALEIQARASVLVAFDCLHLLCVPMKVFDYAAMRGSLLLIGNRHGAMAEAAMRLGTEVCSVDDPDALDRVLAAAFDRWRSGAPMEVNDPEGLFGRPRQAALLDRLLHQVARVTSTSRVDADRPSLSIDRPSWSISIRSTFPRCFSRSRATRPSAARRAR